MSMLVGCRVYREKMKIQSITELSKAANPCEETKPKELCASYSVHYRKFRSCSVGSLVSKLQFIFKTPCLINQCIFFSFVSHSSSPSSLSSCSVLLLLLISHM